MKKLFSSLIFVKINLVIASLVPFYFIYMYANNDNYSISSLIVLIGIAVCLVHLYFGFRFAKYIILLINIIFSFSQIYIFMKYEILYLKIIGYSLSILLITNTIYIFRSVNLKSYLLNKYSNISSTMLKKLKISRIIFLALISVGILLDIYRLIKE